MNLSQAEKMKVLIDDHVVASRTELPKQQGKGKIKASQVSLWVRRIAGDFYLNIEDPNNPEAC